MAGRPAARHTAGGPRVGPARPSRPPRPGHTQAATLTPECSPNVSGSSRSIENDGPADPIVVADGLRYLRWVVSGITGSDKAVISITGVGR
jgi:hypothetical protein